MKIGDKYSPRQYHVDNKELIERIYNEMILGATIEDIKSIYGLGNNTAQLLMSLAIDNYKQYRIFPSMANYCKNGINWEFTRNKPESYYEAMPLPKEWELGPPATGTEIFNKEEYYNLVGIK